MVSVLVDVWHSLHCGHFVVCPAARPGLVTLEICYIMFCTSMYVWSNGHNTDLQHFLRFLLQLECHRSGMDILYPVCIILPQILWNVLSVYIHVLL